MSSGFNHYSVMLNECIDGLNIKPNGLYVDCTAGGGGHSLEIVKRLNEGGRLIAIDRDQDAINAVKTRLADYTDRLELVHDNFANIMSILNGRKADGILIDLGISSYQIDTPERGFSYMHDAPLDMRMNRNEPVSAYDIVNKYSEQALADIIFKYGEERFSRRIASFIAERRKAKPIQSTLELASLVSDAIPPKFKEKGSHPAKRTFQAIRIEVNHELDIIEPTVHLISEALCTGGRMAVITFHSLEDRLVKQSMNELSKGCTCPPDFPVCVCGGKSKIRILTKKPILPSEAELSENSRSHSAKLRIAERL